MFKCDKCALCCKNLNLNSLYRKLDRGDGVCKYLDEQKKLCKIYENRPLICNVDAMYDLMFSNQMSRLDYYQLNKKSCQTLRKKE